MTSERPGPTEAATNRGAESPFVVSGTSAVVLAWDAPNIDVTLHGIHESSGPPPRPDFRAVAAWLVGLARPEDDVEAAVFTAIPEGRGTQLLPWVRVLRASGYAVFAQPRADGDIDPALDAYVRSRLDVRSAPGTLVLATHDQALAGPLGDAATARGWEVVSLGFRESAGWTTHKDGWTFVDLEDDVPGSFARPLDRVALDALPTGGRWFLPIEPMRRAASTTT